MLEQGSRRNRKFAGDCAEPVEDESSLWKALGKDSQNLAADLRGSTQIKTPEKKARPKPCPSNQRSSAESAAKEHGGCPIPDSALFAEFRACPESKGWGSTSLLQLLLNKSERRFDPLHRVAREGWARNLLAFTSIGNFSESGRQGFQKRNAGGLPKWERRVERTLLSASRTSPLKPKPGLSGPPVPLVRASERDATLRSSTNDVILLFLPGGQFPALIARYPFDVAAARSVLLSRSNP